MRRWWFLLLALVLVAGCGGSGQRGPGVPFYQRGRGLVLKKDYEEGKKAFEICLQRQPDYAPAHLELGMLCEEQFHDPWPAAYHYREFLRLDPEHSQRSVVERWLSRVELELLKDLTERHPEAAASKDLTALRAERDDLTRRLTNAATLFRQMETDNESLREQLAKAEESRLVAMEDTMAVAKSREKASEPPVAPKPPEPTPKPVVKPAVKPVELAKPALPEPPKPVASVRLHAVVEGDTLAAISRQYYGSVKYWPQLQDCNQEALRGGTRLTIGQQLRIPSLAELRKLSTMKEGARD